MDHFTLSLVVGGVAGLVVVIPLFMQRVAMRTCLAAFLSLFFTAVIVFYSDLPYLPWWSEGMAVALMFFIPLALTAAGKERKATPLLLFNALLMGLLISAAEHYL